MDAMPMQTQAVFYVLYDLARPATPLQQIKITGNILSIIGVMGYGLGGRGDNSEFSAVLFALGRLFPGVTASWKISFLRGPIFPLLLAFFCSGFTSWVTGGVIQGRLNHYRDPSNGGGGLLR
ncbi:hypothetical protein VTJ04DRAFT_1032 [Mycothermus thermophilus]|uniref:uncharacterized protein n=1 Tax=Humicola insolens TaxID=85995 RepID=UPI003742CA41